MTVVWHPHDEDDLRPETLRDELDAEELTAWEREREARLQQENRDCNVTVVFCLGLFVALYLFVKLGPVVAAGMEAVCTLLRW